MRGFIKSLISGSMILVGIQFVSCYYANDYNYPWLIAGDIMILAGLDWRYGFLMGTRQMKVHFYKEGKKIADIDAEQRP